MSKILMINLPYSGHTLPTLALAKELVNNGHQVDYILSHEWKEKIEATGANFIPYDDFPKNPTFNQARILCFIAAYNTAIRIGESYDLILYEMFFFLGKALADKLGKPAICQCSMFAFNDNSFKYLADRFWKWKMLYYCKPISRILTKTLGVSSILKEKDLIREMLSNQAEINIIYTSREFQLYNNSFPAPKYNFVGPAISKRPINIIIPYQDMNQPIIYISLGTIFNNYKTFYKKCISAFAKMQVSVIMSVGNSIKVSDLGVIPSNCFVYHFVPQLEVLQHASLFITHGGMNSINEAMYYGVPMLVFPNAGDQPGNSDHIEFLNLGKKMNINKVTPTEIKDAVLYVLNDQTIKKSIEQMSIHMKEAGGIKKAAEIIDMFIKDI